MSNLTPEVRVDKNGTAVTRHVKTGEPVALRLVTSAKPKPAAIHAPKLSTDLGYDSAREAFIDNNEGREEMFDEFFLGSSETEDDLDSILEDNELNFEDVKMTQLPNGRVAFWVDDENLNIPDDLDIRTEARDYKEVLFELQAIADTEYGGKLIESGENDIEVYAAYIDLHSTSTLAESIKEADEKYRGHYGTVAEFGEETFKSIWGMDSSEGANEISNYIEWDDVAEGMTKYEIGIVDEDDEEADETPDGDDVQSYFENSLGDVSSLESYVNWESFGNAALMDYESHEGHYFR